MTDPLHLSPGQREALEALVTAGDMKSAALHLGITMSALDNRLRQARVRNDATTFQLVHRLGQQDRER